MNLKPLDLNNSPIGLFPIIFRPTGSEKCVCVKEVAELLNICRLRCINLSPDRLARGLASQVAVLPPFLVFFKFKMVEFSLSQCRRKPK